jgi:hypothetical protein
MTMSVTRSVTSNRRRSLLRGVLSAVALYMGLGFFSAAPVYAASTVTAASCEYKDVVAALTAASDGGTVKVPAGICTWDSQLVIGPGQIALLGAGIDRTIIHTTVRNANSYLVTYSHSVGGFELAGFTFDGGDGIGGLFLGANVPTTGTKIHDNKFTHFRQRALTDNGLAYGVVYNNQFVDNFVDVGSIGAESSGWNAPFQYGDANTMFVEDNTFIHSTDAYRGQIYYNAQGGRMVMRNNTASGFIDFDIADNHGNMGVYPNRGTVGAEVYDNTFDLTPGTYSAFRFFFHRGGQLMAFNNTVTGGSAYIDMSEEDAWKTSNGCPCPILDRVTNSFYWHNTAKGSEMSVTLNHNPEDATNVVEGVHYFRPAFGADANRPAMCTSGQFYGATDTKKMYRCGTSNTWSLYYQPYTYPHPLRGGSATTPTAPAAPVNVRILQ